MRDLLKTWFFAMIAGDSIYYTTPSNGKNYRLNPDGVVTAHTQDCQNIASADAQFNTLQTIAEDAKHLMFTTYESVRDSLIHLDNNKDVLNEIIDTEDTIYDLLLELQRKQDSFDSFLPTFVNNLNSKLDKLSTQQTGFRDAQEAENFPKRMTQLEEMIKESAKLSQKAIITYSVVIIICVMLIIFAVLLFASHFAANATPETPFVQRVAQSVFDLLPHDSRSTMIVHADSTKQ